MTSAASLRVVKIRARSFVSSHVNAHLYFVNMSVHNYCLFVYLAFLLSSVLNLLFKAVIIVYTLNMTCICYLQTLPKIPIGINTEMKLFIELCIWVVQLTTNFFAFMCKKIYTYKNNTVNLSAQNSYSIQHLNHI